MILTKTVIVEDEKTLHVLHFIKYTDITKRSDFTKLFTNDVKELQRVEWFLECNDINTWKKNAGTVDIFSRRSLNFLVIKIADLFVT